ncbi:MAG TPA: hypothetical protein VKX16_07290 [Chloroflexota bacterium]|nr:hypothetical protein [Chloroflexota bacterium]
MPADTVIRNVAVLPRRQLQLRCADPERTREPAAVREDTVRTVVRRALGRAVLVRAAVVRAGIDRAAAGRGAGTAAARRVQLHRVDDRRWLVATTAVRRAVEVERGVAGAIAEDRGREIAVCCGPGRKAAVRPIPWPTAGIACPGAIGTVVGRRVRPAVVE